MLSRQPDIHNPLNPTVSDDRWDGNNESLHSSCVISPLLTRPQNENSYHKGDSYELHINGYKVQRDNNINKECSMS